MTCYLKDNLFCSFIFLFGMLAPSFGYSLETTENFHGVWAGIEVMGCDKNTANKIRKLIPIQNGMSFNSLNKEELHSWCENIKKEIPYLNIKCGFIGYLEGNYYFNVEVLSNNLYKNNFRVIPSEKSVPVLPHKLEKLHDELENYIINAIQTGVDPKENYDKGYLDYKEPKMHAVALKLSYSVRRYNNTILNILRCSNDSKQREKAATLLSWAKKPNNLHKIIEWDLLNDPDPNVRNNLTRSISFEFETIKEKTLLKKIIPLLCKQATLPSHGDRNKALVSLKSILENNPTISSEINHECNATLEYISESSVLPNAGGIAKELLNKIKANDNV